MQLPWRVLIVEDDSATREFFAHSVRNCPQLELAGLAASVAEACQHLSAPGMQIDVLLTDLGLPDGSGLDVIRFALKHQSQCEALVISMFGDEDNVLSSIEAGATGYIHKDSAPDDIAQSVLQLKAGLSPISPMIARRVLSKYRSMAQDEQKKQQFSDVDIEKLAIKSVVNVAVVPEPIPDPERPLLSPSEHEVLELIARGFSYNEISKLRHVSVHTVQTHIKNLYTKLAVHSKSEAVYEATKLGILAR
jgi:DNA-binding NarL/FixJ family response regulator